MTVTVVAAMFEVGSRDVLSKWAAAARLCGERPQPAAFTVPRGVLMHDVQIQLAIKAAPEEVWSALVSSHITPSYYLGFEAHFDLQVGAPYRYTVGGGEVISGTVTAVEPGRRLATTFNGTWAPDVAALPESQVVFEVVEPFMPMPGVTFLSCTHSGLPDNEIAGHLHMGWVSILSGLKTVLETGAPLVGAAN
jgi:uncharacterized protein YndB with AHSA1/START domain